MKFIIYLVIIIGIFFIDLYTKKRALIKGKQIIYNKGAFIGVLKNNRKLLLVLQIISLIVIIALIFYADKVISEIALVIIIGGSIGNLYEHIVKRKVSDFIKIGKLYINYGDIFIFLGFLIFLISSI